MNTTDSGNTAETVEPAEITVKRAAALKLLAATGIWRSNYEPLAFRTLWRFGIDVPPPHFVSFYWTAFIAGGYFAMMLGLGMSMFPLMHRGFFPVRIILCSAGGAGIFFGLAMAGYYAYGRRKHAIPLWRDFNPGKETGKELDGGPGIAPKSEHDIEPKSEPESEPR